MALRDPPLRAALTAGQRRLQTDFARLLDQQASDLGASYRVDTGLLAGALLAAADGTSVAHALDPAGQHQEAYAWALASLIVNAMDPPPIDRSDWAGFAAALLDTAGSIPDHAPR
jgi:molybdopterin biosynthesis enzyme